MMVRLESDEALYKPGYLFAIQERATEAPGLHPSRRAREACAEGADMAYV